MSRNSADGLSFIFENFILRLKSGLLNRITSNFNFKFLFYGSTLELADDCKKSHEMLYHDTNSARQ